MVTLTLAAVVPKAPAKPEEKKDTSPAVKEVPLHPQKDLKVNQAKPEITKPVEEKRKSEVETKSTKKTEEPKAREALKEAPRKNPSGTRSGASGKLVQERKHVQTSKDNKGQQTKTNRSEKMKAEEERKQ